nr:ribonuclease H-like domain-containing protein [Tanacetum cinerariifolium]
MRHAALNLARKILIVSTRLDKNKEGLGYSAVPPPPAQVYSPPKKDMSWTSLPEFADDTITDYSRPSPAIEKFGDSYEALKEDAAIASDGSTKKKGRTVTFTTEDMQKRKNDVKARTTLLLSLPDEHQLRFSKYKTAQELWAAILKIFGGIEATKRTKKNLLKQQYGNFKAEGTETLEQTFNRLGNEEVNTASLSTASTNVSSASANIGAASVIQDATCTYIASKSSGSAELPEAKTEEEETITDKGLRIESLKNELELLKKQKGIPEFADDTVTDYGRPSPAIESTFDDAQNRNPSVPEIEASPSTILSKPAIKFVNVTPPKWVAAEY